jgi:hypothetical protein
MGMPQQGDRELEPDGPVERWLDEVFGGLTGTGPAGRRVLAEFEDHLRTAVAEGITGGLTAIEAEREAVARFGPPGQVARGIRAAHRNILRPAITGRVARGIRAAHRNILRPAITGRVARGIRAAHRNILCPAITGTWLLAGAMTVALGAVTTLTASLSMVFADRPTGRGWCHSTVVRADGHVQCGDMAGDRLTAFAGLAVIGIGLLALVVLHLLRRFTAMSEANWLPTRRVQIIGGTLAALAVAAILGNPTNAFGVPQFRMYSLIVPAVCAIIATALGLGTAAALARLPTAADTARGRLGPRAGW